MDQGPLSRLGFISKDCRNLLQHAKFLFRGKIESDDPATLNGIINNLVRLACWQGTRGMSTTDMEALMKDIRGVLDRTKPNADGSMTESETGLTEEEEFCLIG